MAGADRPSTVGAVGHPGCGTSVLYCTDAAHADRTARSTPDLPGFSCSQGVWLRVVTVLSSGSLTRESGPVPLQLTALLSAVLSPVSPARWGTRVVQAARLVVER
jgi:hypothetical protein